MTLIAVLLLSFLAGMCAFAGAFVMSESFMAALAVASAVASACFLLLALVQIGSRVVDPIRRSR